jgi:uncharacterized repeat protein (TIGR03809 family)
MPESDDPLKRGEIARQWRSLAERRRAHLLELHRTGRWRKYYSEDRLMAKMREVVREIEDWDRFGGIEAPIRRTTAPQADNDP